RDESPSSAPVRFRKRWFVANAVAFFFRARKHGPFETVSPARMSTAWSDVDDAITFGSTHAATAGAARGDQRIWPSHSMDHRIVPRDLRRFPAGHRDLHRSENLVDCHARRVRDSGE